MGVLRVRVIRNSHGHQNLTSFGQGLEQFPDVAVQSRENAGNVF